MNWKMNLFDLPHDIILIISSHITLTEYTQLRISSTNCHLPNTARLTWEGYMESITTIRNAKWRYLKNFQYSKYLEPDLEFMDDYRIGVLTQHCQSLNVNKVLSAALSPYIKQILFEYSIRLLHFKLFLDLVNDPQIDRAFHDNLAIEMAFKTGNLEMIRILLLDINVNPNRALKRIHPQSDLDCIRFLIQHYRTNLDKSLILLIENGFTDLACELIQSKTLTSETSVYWTAAYHNNWKVMKAWITRNNHVSHYELFIYARAAISQGHTDVLDVLLNHTGILDDYSFELMRWVATHRHADAMKKILPLANITSESINDVLYYACMSGDRDIMIMLLKDSRIDKTDLNTFRPIHGTVVGNHLDCLEYLLVDCKLEVDQKSFILACRTGKLNCLLLLLAYGKVDPSCGVKFAALYDNPDCLQLLIEDERFSLQYYHAKSLLHRVRKLEFFQSVDILQKYIDGFANI
ncbi:hypothetical protein BC833DRAFT_576393 [Globomyces pollinis-pini]|nr:hypothetical protein BC833DRAFT_576393 [Globomyces pollinis-pini]